MIKIRVPATSANLGPGFDTLGIAFDIYNNYEFEESNEFELIGFKKEYLNHNLVKESYEKTFKYLGIDVIKAKIKIKQGIPNCGGLGSSANCIVAGVLGALRLSRTNLSTTEIVQLCTRMEGHPDNVVPAVLGYLTSAVFDEDVAFFRYAVCPQLKFAFLIPDACCSTGEMRKVLPKTVDYKDAIFNLSRAANITNAFERGDFNALKILTKDRLHQRYRLPNIKDGDKIIEECRKQNLICLISGSGSSLLVISEEKIKVEFEGYKTVLVHVDNNGAKIW